MVVLFNCLSLRMAYHELNTTFGSNIEIDVQWSEEVGGVILDSQDLLGKILFKIYYLLTIM